MNIFRRSSMENRVINRLAYLNTLNERKRPLDILLKIIEIECYNYDFNELDIITTSGKSIKDIIKEKYSIEIDDYILKKWISTKFAFDKGKIRLCITNPENQQEEISKIKQGEEEFRNKVSQIRGNFIKFTNSNYSIKLSNEGAKDIFNNYIYTVVREQNISNGNNRFFFIFQQYLKYLYNSNNREDLNIIENFGIANQIQDLVLNDDVEDKQFLKGCIIFIDTPLVMKWLGYDGIELSNIYKDFFMDLKKAGATLRVFEHTFEEIWGILFNFKRCIAQNIFDAKGVNTFLKARKEFFEKEGKDLSLEKEVIRKNIIDPQNNLSIEIFDISKEDDIENKTDFSDWNFDPNIFKKHIIKEDENYQKYKSRLEKDIQSIAAVSRLRQRNKISKIETFKDGKFYLLVDNYALANAIKAYHFDIEEKIKKNEILLENTIIFNLWQNLSNNGSLNKGIFRSKCFALNTIDDSFKDSLYRETRKIEAYNSEVEINDQLVNNPNLEDEVYSQSIKEGKLDKEYLSKTLLNCIAKREQKQNEIIKFKEAEKKRVLQKFEKERDDKKRMTEQYKKDLEHQKVYAENKSRDLLENYKKQKLQEKSEELINKWYIKIYFYFLKFNKNFDEKEYVWNKASKIMKIYDVPYTKSIF